MGTSDLVFPPEDAMGVNSIDRGLFCLLLWFSNQSFQTSEQDHTPRQTV